MQYLVYFAVATPVLLGWLFWQAATMPPQPPLFASGYEHISPEPIRQQAAAPAETPVAKKKIASNGASSSN